MKTSKTLIFAVLLMAFATSACGAVSLINRTIEGSGNIISEERQVSGFDQLTLSGIGELRIQQGDEESLTVRTDDNIMPYVRSEVRNNTLVLDLDDSGWDRGYNPTDGIHFDLMVKDLSRINNAGAGSMVMEALESESLILDLSGVGSIEIGDLTANELVVRQSGAGTVFISGQVEGQELDHSGIGSYHAADLESKTGIISISGAGSATVWVTENLDIKISGLGNVIYYGNPRITQDVSGLGRLVGGEK
jgi:predicted small secreted protein